MQFRAITVTPFQQNCSLLWCEETGKAALVDPGGEPERIVAAVQEERVELERILLGAADKAAYVVRCKSSCRQLPRSAG